MNLITLILVVALIATVVSLVGGMTSMVGHGQAGHRTSEQWMIMRVAFQALAVAMILLLMFVH